MKASAPGRGRSRRLRTSGAVAATLLLVGFGWWWLNPPDPIAALATRHRALLTVERVPAPELGARFERWRMIGADGDTVTGLWRAAGTIVDPAAAGRGDVAALGPDPRWAVVLLGGIGTDDRAAMLVPDSLPVGVLAVSWPWKGPRHMSRLEFVRDLPAIRAALLGTPAAMARGVEAVRRESPGSHVALIGVSLGVAPTVGAASLARVDALALVDGAADLRRLLVSEIRRALGGGVSATLLAPPGAALGARLIDPLEPARHAASLHGVPTLLMDAERDERYPRECVARLHAGFPDAVRTTHTGAHLRPEDRRQVAQIVGAVWGWLDTLTVKGDRRTAPR